MFLDVTPKISNAFAPTKIGTTSTSTGLSAWIEDTVVGVTPPAGFFDPLGLSVGKDDATMAFYREAELKHARVAMAACLGWYLNAGGVHPAFNSALSNDPLKAMVELPLAGWLQFVLGCGAIEWLGQQIKERPGYEAGECYVCFNMKSFDISSDLPSCVLHSTSLLLKVIYWEQVTGWTTVMRAG